MEDFVLKESSEKQQRKKEKCMAKYIAIQLLPSLNNIKGTIPSTEYCVIYIDYDRDIPKIIKTQNFYLISSFFTMGLSSLYYPKLYISSKDIPDHKKYLVHSLIMELRKKGIDLFYD